MFTVLCLHGIQLELESTKTQILGSAFLPPLTKVFSKLFRSTSITTYRGTTIPEDHSALATTQIDHRRCGGRHPWPQCSYGNRLGHT